MFKHTFAIMSYTFLVNVFLLNKKMVLLVSVSFDFYGTWSSMSSSQFAITMR